MLKSVPDEYLNSYRMQISYMKEWIKKKEDQNYDLMQKLASVKVYAVLLKEFLDKKFTQDGKVLP